MSYHIYTTRGIVLSGRAFGEADRLYSILTRDLGLIWAEGKAVRSESSKLRGSLEPYSVSSVSLVRGKSKWRITGANTDFGLSKLSKDVFQALARVCSLLDKLVAGEAKHSELFDTVEAASLFAMSNELNKAEVEMLEILLLAKVLRELGYISPSEVPDEITQSEFSREALNTALQSKKTLVGAINDGIKASDLT